MRTLVFLLSLFLFSTTQATTAFTYQGQLSDNQALAQGSYDFQFMLFNAADNGTQIGSTISKTGLVLSEGVFTTELDFGSNVFTGINLWLEIQVKPTTGSFVSLSPRQKINSVPYAVLAQSVSADSISSSEIQDLSILAEDINPNEIQQRVTGSCTTGNAIASIDVDGQVLCQAIPLAVTYGKFVIVAKSGGDYSTINEAIINIENQDQWCSNPSLENPCTIYIMPGVYDIGNTNIVLDSAVNLKGSGMDSTIIRSSYISQADGILFVESEANLAKISDLTIQWNGADSTAESDPVHLIYDETGSQYENIKLRISQKPAFLQAMVFSGANTQATIKNIQVISDNTQFINASWVLIQLDTIKSISIDQFYADLQLKCSFDLNTLKGISGVVNNDFSLKNSTLDLGIQTNSNQLINSQLIGIEINTSVNAINSHSNILNSQMTMRPEDLNNGPTMNVRAAVLNTEKISIQQSFLKVVADPINTISNIISLLYIGAVANTTRIDFSQLKIENTAGATLLSDSNGLLQLSHSQLNNAGIYPLFSSVNSTNICGLVLGNAANTLGSNCL